MDGTRGTHGREENKYRPMMGKDERKNLFGRPRIRWDCVD
jgi:hypothetical protein